MRLTVCARLLPDGHLQGTVESAGAAEVFEGWLELLATLSDLLGPTDRAPPP